MDVFTVAQHASADRSAANHGLALSDLMEPAGAAIAREIARRWAPRETLVLCGPGDNGGDGYVAAKLLKARGWPVRIAALDQPEGASPAAQAARTGWDGDVETLTASSLGAAELVVDALFGAGLSRPVAGAAAEVLEACATRDVIVVAADLPSGLAGDTGAPLGVCAPAVLTVTFLRLKPAHLLAPGRSLCGETICADIGHPVEALNAARAEGPALVVNAPAVWGASMPLLNVEAHKHSRGQLGVVTGGPSATGAARLAARAGLRAGAGLVTLFAPPNALLVVAAASTAVMTRAFKDAEALAELGARCDAVVIGPGAGTGEGTRANVAALAGNDATRLILDADALTSFEDAPEELFALLGPDDVMTPHLGEFRRLFPDIAAHDGDKISKARAASARAGCVVLLKGPDTVVAAPDGTCAVNVHASPHLATAGSGDVLAGVIAGLAAQGAPGWQAACAGAWLHGEAGLTLGPGLIAEDLCEALPRALDAFHRKYSA